MADADFKDVGTAGEYCANLPSYKTYNASIDEPITSFDGGVDVLVVPDGGACNGAGFGPANTIVLVVDTTGAFSGSDFDIQLGT